jgi:hypothetical protein
LLQFFLPVCPLPSFIFLSKIGYFVCFACTYAVHPPNLDVSDHVLGLFGKLSRRRGTWTCGVEVLEYWMISSLKIKLNCSWKFSRNCNVFLVLLERSWWAGFNGIYLVRFGFRLWETLFFSDFCQWKLK